MTLNRPIALVSKQADIVGKYIDVATARGGRWEEGGFNAPDTSVAGSYALGTGVGVSVRPLCECRPVTLT